MKRIWRFFSGKNNKEQETAKAVSESTAKAMVFPSAGLGGETGNLSLGIYEKMQTDAQICASLNLKKLGVLAAPWALEPADDSAEHRHIRDFVMYNFDQMTGSINSILWKAMDAFAKGYSALEMLYKVADKEPYKGKYILKNVKSKNPATIGFDVDEYLNPVSLILHIPGEAPIKLPRWKFILYVYNPKYENPHGESDLKAAYSHWFAKTALIKFWSIYLEKFGSPTAVGTYKRGLPSESQDELLMILNRLHQENALVVPDDIEVKLLQAIQNGGRGFLEAIEYHNKEIARAILGQTLTTDEGRRVGSLGLGLVHFQVMLLQLQALRRELAETVVNEQVIRPLVDMNFTVSKYPKLIFQETPLTAFVTGQFHAK